MPAHSSDTYWSVEGLSNEEITTLNHESHDSTEFQTTPTQHASIHCSYLYQYGNASVYTISYLVPIRLS